MNGPAFIRKKKKCKCSSRNNYFSHGGAVKLLDEIHNEINRAISGFRRRSPRICNGRESDKECPITRVGKSGTPRHAGHVSPIIYESITYLPNFWSTRHKLSVGSAPYNPRLITNIIAATLIRARRGNRPPSTATLHSIILRFYAALLL